MAPPFRQARRVVGAILVFVAASVIVRLGANLIRSDTRGAQPLRALALSRRVPVSEAARAGLAMLDTSSFGFAHLDWVAVIDQRPRGDTLTLGLFRAEDAAIIRRMLTPHPYISGVVRYDSARHRLIYAGVGIE